MKDEHLSVSVARCVIVATNQDGLPRALNEASVKKASLNLGQHGHSLSQYSALLQWTEIYLSYAALKKTLEGRLRYLKRMACKSGAPKARGSSKLMRV